jgi:hypothetical protein
MGLPGTRVPGRLHNTTPPSAAAAAAAAAAAEETESEENQLVVCLAIGAASPIAAYSKTAVWSHT